MNEKYLIKNTTKEQRQQIIDNAISLSTLDAQEPTPFGKALYQNYIDGEMELDEIEAKIIEQYSQFGAPEGEA